MSMALIAVLVYGVNVAGGWDAVVLDNARSLPGYLTMAGKPQCGRQHRHLLQSAGHRVHAGLGPGLLRHAPYPAALHGH